jgi:hypothetical protein
MLTLSDGPPWEGDVGEERVQGNALRPLVLLPHVKRLSEPPHRPQWVYRSVVQL